MVSSKSGKRERIPAAAAGAGGGGGGSLHERHSRFKGVRMRSWGKWVSEIRLPNTRTRLWLGSFATAQQAARAFDVAVVCLRGRSATLNFPDSPPAHAPLGLPLRRIQQLAAAAASDDAPSAALSGSTNRTASPTSRSSSAPPASPLSTQSEPAFLLQALATQSDSAAFCPQSEPASAACSPSYSCCDPLETATLSDSCSSTWQRTEELQALAWMQEEELRLEAQWDELLRSSSLSSSLAWEPHSLTFPMLPPQDNMAEDCLWSL